MDMFNVSGHGNAETYLIQQRAEMNPILTSPGVEQVGAMYNEGNTTEAFVDQQGLYYPAATNYGYYCTGFETPGEWADHQKIFGVDGSEIHYAGAQTESLPYVYYTPSYGYAQSPYNPYNPYIPGAVVGVDDPYAGAQQYYTVPSYQDAVASSGYIPVVVQSDILPNGSAVPSLDTGVALSNRPDGKILKHGHSSSSAAFHRNPPKPASNQTNLLTRIPEGPRANVGASNQSLTQGGASSGGFSTRASSYVVQNRSASGRIHAIDNISNGKVHPHHNQLKVTLPINNGFSDFGSSAHGQTAVDKLRSNIHVGRTLNDFNGNSELLDEQNRGPRINKSKNQLAVKAYTTKLGDSNALGNIIIHTEQYNKDDFMIDCADAKYFVIKSYSEDDVHKSIKYNVWSSTPHGNKKLQVAYEEAQKIAAGKPRGCPIFLFFSVNASGQFCGVAEMIGPVDFHKDMDFWQQDKWSGSFPVKWHIIKDIPNSSLRHIILVNNENKPVTNSRDTQEIMHKQGLETLKIFKNHPLKTSLLDDFMYYENRQKIMHEGKARLIFKSFRSPLLVPALDATQKLNGLVEWSPNKDEKIMKQNDPNMLKKGETDKDEKVVDQNVFNDSKKRETNKDEKIMNQNDISISSRISAAKQPTSHSGVTNSSRTEDSSHATLDADGNTAAVLKIGSLDLNPKQAESSPLSHAANKSVDIVTVGSVPVKANGLAESSRFLTVGTIALDPRSLQLEKRGAFAKQGSQN